MSQLYAPTGGHDACTCTEQISYHKRHDLRIQQYRVNYSLGYTCGVLCLHMVSNFLPRSQGGAIYCNIAMTTGLRNAHQHTSLILALYVLQVADYINIPRPTRTYIYICIYFIIGRPSSIYNTRPHNLYKIIVAPI